MAFCTNCGAEIDDSSSFCTKCGQRVAGTAPAVGASANAPTSQAAAQPAYAQPTAYVPQAGNDAPEPSDKKKGRAAVIIAVAAVLVIAAIALVVIFVIKPFDTQKATYEIQYETDGGTGIAYTQVDEGESVEMPAEPTKEGFEFDGWYFDKDFTQPANFPFDATENLVIYAKWNEVDSGDASDDSASKKSESLSSSTKATRSTKSSKSSDDTVSVSIVGADGTTRTADIKRSGTSERVFPDSNSTKLSASDVKGLSDAELCIAWNEIIAASNGYSFKNSGLSDYFNNHCSWYSPVSGASGNGDLSSDAAANVEFLKSQLSDDWWLTLATS